MFTGIIEDVGTIIKREAARLTVETKLDDIRAGDSVAVNGICLTATEIRRLDRVFRIDFDYSPTTAAQTTLVRLAPGNRANLERALKLSDRLGGHILTGHIEGTGKLVRGERQGEFILMTFSFPDGFGRYLVEKGSVGVDGISLTVAAMDDTTFKAAVIPHTVEHTGLQFLGRGDDVNLEPDIIAKYVAGYLSKFGNNRKLTVDFLKENGFI